MVLKTLRVLIMAGPRTRTLAPRRAHGVVTNSHTTHQPGPHSRGTPTRRAAGASHPDHRAWQLCGRVTPVTDIRLCPTRERCLPAARQLLPSAATAEMGTPHRAPEEGRKIREFLCKNGYCIVPNVLTPEFAKELAVSKCPPSTHIRTPVIPDEP